MQQAKKLSYTSDLELIDLIKNNADSEAFVEVCRRYEKVFYMVCNKYVTILNKKGIPEQDVLDEKNHVILHCVNIFDKSRKACLGTLIGNYARYLCLNVIKTKRFVAEEFYLDNQEIDIEKIQTGSCKFEKRMGIKNDYVYLVNLLKQIDDERVYKIFELRYINSNHYYWKDISKMLNISVQRILELHEWGLKLLKNKFNSEHISDEI